MLWKIIALAVAGLMSGAAFAQSNVTVYGIADMYYAYGSASGTDSQNVINSGGLSGSRIGFKGVEALGNGLSALFTLEYGIGVDANSGLVDASGNQARQQLVGLTGGFGTVVAGYAQTAGYDWSCSTGSVSGTGLDAAGKLNWGGATTALLSCGKAGRAGNAVAYISPSFGGLTVAYNHARVTEDAEGQATDKDAYANLLSASYANGPIGAGLVYSKVTAAHTAASDNVAEYGLTGSYDFKVAKVFASYQTHKVGDASRNNRWSVTGAVPVGAAGTVHVSYGNLSMKSTAADDDATAWSIGYTHGLSKRTTAYAGYVRVSNDGVATYKALITPLDAGGNSSMFVAGVRHAF